MQSLQELKCFENGKQGMIRSKTFTETKCGRAILDVTKNLYSIKMYTIRELPNLLIFPSNATSAVVSFSCFPFFDVPLTIDISATSSNAPLAQPCTSLTPLYCDQTRIQNMKPLQTFYYRMAW